VTGRHHWVVLEDAELVGGPSGSKYKWLIGASEYVAPLEATAYGFDAFGRFGWVRPPPGAPHLEQFPELVSAHLSLRRTLRVYLPAGFVPRGPAAARARTLLVHDGQNVFHPDAAFGGWRLDEALADPTLSDVVVLAIDNAADRMEAYTHVADDIGAGGPIGGRASDYLALLEDEALPFVRARYGVEARGASLAMMGSSLGGLVTAFAALERRDLFGCGAALSPTLGWGSFAPGASDALVQRWPAHGRGATALYLDSGGGVVGTCADLDGDGVDDDAADRDNYCVTVQLRDRLVELGYAFGVDLAHWHEPGASHDEAAWAARVPRALAACSAMGWAAP
jgi:predicted alpha/beta superfamily hydrolase